MIEKMMCVENNFVVALCIVHTVILDIQTFIPAEEIQPSHTAEKQRNWVRALQIKVQIRMWWIFIVPLRIENVTMRIPGLEHIKRTLERLHRDYIKASTKGNIEKFRKQNGTHPTVFWSNTWKPISIWMKVQDVMLLGIFETFQEKDSRTFFGGG